MANIAPTLKKVHVIGGDHQLHHVSRATAYTIPFTNNQSITMDGVTSQNIVFDQSAPGNMDLSTDSMTISLWHKWTGSNIGANYYFTRPASGGGLGAYYTAASVLSVFYRSTEICTSNPLLKYFTGQWFNIQIVYTNGVGCKIYVNNVDETAASNTATGTAAYASNFEIGEGTHAGDLGDFMLMPFALNETERAEIYNEGVECDVNGFSRWEEMQTSTKSIYVNWENADLESSGGVKDLTINAATATGTNLTNAANLISRNPGTIEQYFIQQGSGAAADFGNIGTEDATDPMSMSTWIKGISNVYYKTVGGVGLRLYAAADYVQVRFEKNAGTDYAYRQLDSGDGYWTNSNWNHLVVTWNGAGWDGSNWTIYVNGVDRSGTALTVGTYADPSSNADVQLISGSFGQCADFVKYPWALTQAEVTEIYNSGSRLDMTTFSKWSTLKADARSMYINWNSDDVRSTDGIVDLTDNAYKGTGDTLSKLDTGFPGE